jgi:hypothetical protein
MFRAAALPVISWRHLGLVFTIQFGRPVEPRNVLRTVEATAAKAGNEDAGDVHAAYSAAMSSLEAGCTSRPSPICSDTPQSRSPAIYGAGVAV